MGAFQVSSSEEIPIYHVRTVHGPVVEGEEADELLQKPPAADVRELHSTAQNLSYRKP